MTRTYEGLAAEIDEALALTAQLEQIVQHWGMAGIRLQGRKIGAKQAALSELVSELKAMRDDLAPKVPA